MRKLPGLGAMIASDDRTTPQYLEGFVKSEVEKWAVPIKARGRSWSRLTSLRGARSAPKTVCPFSCGGDSPSMRVRGLPG
jgi:hypothetical protein